MCLRYNHKSGYMDKFDFVQTFVYTQLCVCKCLHYKVFFLFEIKQEKWKLHVLKYKRKRRRNEEKMEITTSFFVLKSGALVLLNVFLIAALGYLVGSIKIKGISLGTAGVFLVALVVGHLSTAMPNSIFAVEMPKFVQNLGLVLFVSSVGFIAGPNFFSNLKKNAKSYVLLGLVIIISGALTCVAVTALTNVDAPLAAGMLSGALTSTPGFSAAKEALSGAEELVNKVSVGYGIAYPFGVIGVVLFVQLIPRFLKANMEEERKAIVIVDDGTKAAKKMPKKLIEFDSFGLTAFALSAIIGVIVGGITIPLPGGASFSLGNTGGVLLSSLIFGHLGHIGKFSLQIKKDVLKTFQEFGLMLFLIGAGIEGGTSFVATLSEYGLILFVYGALMTLIPMIIGSIIAKYVLKLSLLNSLGSITGGMTSTPALGTLISVSGTDDVASAYASTYPIALVAIVIVSQLIVTLF